MYRIYFQMNFQNWTKWIEHRDKSRYQIYFQMNFWNESSSEISQGIEFVLKIEQNESSLETSQGIEFIFKWTLEMNQASG